MPVPFLPLLFSAQAAGLALDPAHPPVALGGSHYAFGDHAFVVLPGVVLHLSEGETAPAGAQWLGGRSWHLPVASPTAAVANAQRLAEEGYQSVFPDVITRPRPQSSDDPLREGQWYLDALDIAPLHALTRGDPAVRVAVLDSGIDIAHPDLASKVVAPYDAFDDDEDPSPEPGEYCFDGSNRVCDDHGTAVAGVAVAAADNGAGAVGLCPDCSLVPIKLLGEGTGALSRDVAAFEHAIASDAAVINNSWGFVRPTAVPAPLADVIARAATEPRGGLGALVVFAAGNDDREIRDDELQALADVLCVTATDSYGRYTNYTNHGASVDLSAPSATVSIAPNEGTTTTFGGTSAAAPVVAGLAGWALSVRPELSAAQLRGLLLDTAVPSPLVTHDDAGHHPYYGFGTVDPTALLAALEAGRDLSEEPAGATADETGCATAPGSLAASLLALLMAARRRA